MDKEREIAKLAEIINEVTFIQAHKIDGDEHLCEIVAKALINAGGGEAKQAVREFAEKLKSKMGDRDYMGVHYKQGVFSDTEIDDLLAEVTGE